MARIAERPSWGEAPAWLGRPTRLQIEARDGVAAGDDARCSGRPGSGTSTTACRAASASIRSRVEGLPTSSSLVNRTVTGSGVSIAGGRERADRRQRDEVAALHVEDARPVGSGCRRSARAGCQRADRMHRVEVAEHQDARARPARRCGIRRADAVAVAHPAGDRSTRAPMTARSRAATPIMRLTAAASWVGLSHSTQGRRLASIRSASNGSCVGSIGLSAACSGRTGRRA